LKQWGSEKKRYQLTDVGGGAFAYALKAAMSNGEPPHYICTNCYEQSKKSILNHIDTGDGLHVLSCPRCPAKLVIGHAYKSPSFAETVEDRARAALEPCPICQSGRLKVIKIEDDPLLGRVGLKRRHLRCDNPECSHKDSRQFDPGKK